MSTSTYIFRSMVLSIYIYISISFYVCIVNVHVCTLEKPNNCSYIPNALFELKNRM